MADHIGCLDYQQDRDLLKSQLEEAGAVFVNNGKSSECRCPFHEDRHASAGIFQHTDGAWLFKCHACGETAMDAAAVMARREGMSRSDAVSRLQSTGESPKDSKPCQEPPESFFMAKEREAEGRYAKHWCYTDPKSGQIELVTVRYDLHGGGKTFRQAVPKNGRWVWGGISGKNPLYNRAGIRDASLVVVTEGEKAADALIRNGFAATTAPMGAGKADRADWSPIYGKTVVLWPDADDNGMGADHMKRVAQILEIEAPATKVAILDPVSIGLCDKEDAFDFVARMESEGQSAADALFEVIAEARPQTVTDKYASLVGRFLRGEVRPVAWPYSSITDETQALEPGTITLLCGNPGTGKSFFMLNCIDKWTADGERVRALQFEDTFDFYAGRLIAMREQSPSYLDKGWLRNNPETAMRMLERQREAIDRVVGEAISIPPSSVDHATCLKWVRREIRDKARIIIIDPVSAIAKDPRNPYGSEVSFIQDVRVLVNGTDTSVIWVTHPKNDGMAKPAMNYIQGAAEWTRFAQTVLWLSSNDKTLDVRGDGTAVPCEPNIILDILKARNGSGTGKRYAMDFNRKSFTFSTMGQIVPKKKG